MFVMCMFVSSLQLRCTRKVQSSDFEDSRPYSVSVNFDLRLLLSSFSCQSSS